MSSTLASHQPLASTSPFVKQTRIIRASRQAVYDAWTKPEIMMKWWGPANAVCPAAELDVREGGTGNLTIQTLPQAVLAPGMPRSFIVHCVYTEVVPGERLQFTMQASWNQGEPSLVTVSLRDVDGGTELTLVHEKISADMVSSYELGWASTLGKLDALFAA